MAWIKKFGGLAFRGLLILLGAGSILVFARDGFHLFLHDTLNWIVKLTDGILSAILESTGIDKILLTIAQSIVDHFRLDFELVLQPYWKQAAALLTLALRSHAAAFEDFEVRPAANIFRHLSALLCGAIGGVLAGLTLDLSQVLVLMWPLAAILLYRALQSLWRLFTGVGVRVKIVAGLMTLIQLGSAGYIGYLAVSRMKLISVMEGQGPSPGLQTLAVLVGIWTVASLLLGFGEDHSSRVNRPRLLANPGRRMGFNILALAGAAAAIAATSQLIWSASSAKASNHHQASQSFRDCVDCPEMVNISAGSLAEGRGLMPFRAIVVPNFSIQAKQVTTAEFQAFIDDTGYLLGANCYGTGVGERNYKDSRYRGDPDDPVSCINWWDAKAYTRWLSLKTGRNYRLPTEDEWLYAALIGSRTHWSLRDGETGEKTTEPATWVCNDVDRSSAVDSCSSSLYWTGTQSEWLQNCEGITFQVDGNNDFRYEDDPCEMGVGGNLKNGGASLQGMMARERGISPIFSIWTRTTRIGFRVARTP